MENSFLELKGISKKYSGISILNSIDLTIERGEVMGLVGANGAGKSTLMNILGGIVQKDEGNIYLDGKRIEIQNPINSLKHGIAFVHQEMTALDSMSILDNCMLATFPNTGGIIKMKDARKICSDVFKRLDCDLSLDEKMRNISPGNQQLVEIARVLIQNPKIVIFDEPTSSLSQHERDRLFEIIKKIQKENAAVIYITHLLDELYGLCDKVVVLRNGSLVSQGPISEFPRSRIVRDLTGEELGSVTREHERQRSKDPILTVHGFNRAGLFKDISFDLYQGEILGIWGLMGAGRTEIIRAMTGIDPIDSGVLELKLDEKMKKLSPRELRNHVGLITEDRRNEGLFQIMSVKKNLTVANLKNLLHKYGPFIDFKKENKVTKSLVEKLNIKISSTDQKVSTLSGGNQQKVVIGRWLACDPLIYFMDEPIKGIDVSAKAEIKKIIIELTKQGKSILLISSEIDELLGFCDRYLVLCRGQKTAEFTSSVSRKQLMDAATTVNYAS